MDVYISETVHQLIKNVRNINSKLSDLRRLNIIVAGKTGVGKSTLINSIFRENLAETDVGKPVTTEIEEIEKKNFPLKIYDTPGFELNNSQQNRVKKDIIKLINEGNKKRNINEAIHCVWYCINSYGRRIEDAEIDFLRNLTESIKKTQVPVIIILTQACEGKEAEKMINEIKAENLNISSIIPVLAKDWCGTSAYGLERLMKAMSVAIMSNMVLKEFRF